jgi:hypothetical protein
VIAGCLLGDWLNNLPPAALPAWGGLLISFCLAVIKILELRRDRVRVNVGGDFAGLESVGNQIHIRNLSQRPIILVHWEVFYGSWRWIRREEDHIQSAEDSKGATIAATSTYSLSFTNQCYFSTSVAALRGRAVFIRLYFAGRRPIVRKLYSL